MRRGAWTEPSAEAFLVRGNNYIKDGEKVDSAPAAFRILTVDMISCRKSRLEGKCTHPREQLQQALKGEEEVGILYSELPLFVFDVNLCIPAGRNQYYHQVSYFGIHDLDEVLYSEIPFGKLMNRFLFHESDSFRDQTFKLIPKIVKGNDVVRKAVGTKCSILGEKIKQNYIRGERFLN
jgi:hypothetical protein